MLTSATMRQVLRRAAERGRDDRRAHVIAFAVPAVLVLHLVWGAPVAIVGTLIAIVALSLTPPIVARAGTAPRDVICGPAPRAEIVAALDKATRNGGRAGRCTCAVMIEIDRFRLLEERHDHAVIDRVMQITGDRLTDSLRDRDLSARLDGPTFVVAVAPQRRLDLEAALQLAGRIQRALAEPVAVDGSNIYLTVSIGFALASRLDTPTGEALLQAAKTAMIEAQRSGPSAIRSYSDAMRRRIVTRKSLSDDVTGALERGEIMAFFQPQVSTRTGAITGFETLSRWHHPERGLIPPIEFLPALEQAGLMDRLGEIMVFEALTALRKWDDAGFDIPRVGVNFSNAELSDPRLVDRIGWELDRFDLTPDRLVIEVLETVVADKSEDVVIRNLSGLARLGCRLDLDDFGTGHASITSIRRFSIERIKIDRSFVTRIDADPEQQKMVSAILTMAERLGLDTLAEGVETEMEFAMLARLGCGHVQGFGIARPMPLHETDGWIRSRCAASGGPVSLHRKAV